MVGLFISIEGPDGSGKSTVIKHISQRISEKYPHSVVMTREPGGSEIAEKIRALLLDPANKKMDDRTEALLYAASRRQHIKEKILPALEAGKIVLTDRFVDSSVAYQGEGRGLGMDTVATLNEFATEGLEPDLTLYIDVHPEIGLARIAHKDSRREKDRLELEANDFHHRVRAGYQKLLEEHADRMVYIDGERDAQEVINEAWQYVEEKIKTSDLKERS